MSVKIDKDVRNRARSVAKSIGIPLSMVVNQQLKQFADERRIEFYEPLVPNAKTRKVLDETLRDIRGGRDSKFSPIFTNIKDMDRWLDGRP